MATTRFGFANHLPLIMCFHLTTNFFLPEVGVERRVSKLGTSNLQDNHDNRVVELLVDATAEYSAMACCKSGHNQKRNMQP